MFKPKHFDELEKLLSGFNWQILSTNPNSDEVQDWVAEVSGVLWEFDSPFSTEFQEKIKNLVNMWGGVQAGTLPDYDLSHDVNDIRQFLRTKLVGMRREKEKILSGEKTATSEPPLKFGQPGIAGQPGGGGTVFMQGNINIADTGRVSADGGNHVGQKNITSGDSGDSSPIQTGDANINIGDITDSFNKIREQIPQNIEASSQKKARELLGSLENELKKDNKEQSKITKIFGQIKKISKWLAGQLIQGVVGGLIKAYLPPAMVAELS